MMCDLPPEVIKDGCFSPLLHATNVDLGFNGKPVSSMLTINDGCSKISLSNSVHSNSLK